MKKYLKYIISTVVSAVFVLIIISSKGIYTQSNPQEVMKILTDGFFAVGVIVFCIGLLIVASNGGTFDMLAYGMMKLINLFRRDLTKIRYKTFYDYRQAKADRKRPFVFLLIVGAFFIGISMIFLALYYQY